MTSLVSSPLTLAALLLATEEFLGEGREWNPGSHDDVTRVRQLTAALRSAQLRSVVPLVPEIARIAAMDVDVVNEFLRKHGLDIALNATNPSEIAVAAVTDVGVEWPEEARRLEINSAGGQIYPAFQLKSRWLHSEVGSPDTGHTFWIETKSDDVVGVAMAPRPESEELMLDAIQRRMEKQGRIAVHDAELVLPAIDLNVQPDLSYLLGLWTQKPGEKVAVITQAIMQAIFRMNHLGARSLTGMAAVVSRGITKRPHQIVFDRPFLLWIERPGISEPLCTYYLERSCWSEPPKL